MKRILIPTTVLLIPFSATIGFLIAAGLVKLENVTQMEGAAGFAFIGYALFFVPSAIIGGIIISILSYKSYKLKQHILKHYIWYWIIMGFIFFYVFLSIIENM